MKKQLLVIVLATIIAYLNIFNNQPVIDDHVFLGKYHPTVTEAFLGLVPPGHEGVYRPIRGIFYTIYNQLWGANPFGYHLNSLLVHLASTILVYFIIKKLVENLRCHSRESGNLYNNRMDPPIKSGDDRARSCWLAFIASLFFGLHPIHTETITYIASSMESIGIVFFLLAFYLYLRKKIIPSLVFAFLAFFTTEMTLTLPLLIIFYDWVANRLSKKRLIIYGWYFAVAAIYVAVRFGVLHVTTRGPYLANSFYLTMLTMTKVLMQYLWVLVWPINLVNNHIISPGIEAFVYRNYQTAGIWAQSIFDVDILLSITIIIFIIFIIFKARKKYPLVSFSLGIFFLGLLPVMELVPQGSMMNEKSLYISSLGWVLLLAFMAVKSLKYLKSLRLLILIVAVLATFYGTRTFARNADWQNDITLWQADVRQNPNQNAYARFALGNAYNDKKDYQKAIDQYAKSVEINPGFAVGWASLGRTSADMGKLNEAIAYYQKALAIDPNFWEVKNNLNNIYNRL